MALIELTITGSEDETISGIPDLITIQSDIPATIFYTLNGVTPTPSTGRVYTTPFSLPTDENSVTLKVFATNGTDASHIITSIYGPNIEGARMQYDTVTNVADLTNVKYDSFPYSDLGPRLPARYGQTGLDIVDLPGVPGYSIGFDGTGTGTSAGETDKTAESLEQDIVFSTTDQYGQPVHGIGTLPVVTIEPTYHPEDQATSDIRSESLPNTKARVIYQDNTKPDRNPDIKNINRPQFTLENPIDRDGCRYSVLDSNTITGSFVRAELDVAKKTMTFYYYDNVATRWIISTEPYDVKDCPTRNLSRILFPSRGQGSQYCYEWHPFIARKMI